MPDITTLFEGTDGATRENFNQKLSEVNAHGNDTTVHITAAERATWNGKATTATYNATLTTAGWSASAPYTQTVTVSGLLATYNPIADVVLSGTASTAQAQLEAWGCVGRMVAAANSFTAYCYETKPTTAIPLQIKVVR
ncbi:hypothetical protein [Faecalispora jeddahensis]|uniref:hypothetical protein n=1 Tax=Faecalispora jeddahensis TaxID=1414721 RepID=UPI0027BA6C89|nr:hypothetical protein [Faecalispora jeddahensis]